MLNVKKCICWCLLIIECLPLLMVTVMFLSVQDTITGRMFLFQAGPAISLESPPPLWYSSITDDVTNPFKTKSESTFQSNGPLFMNQRCVSPICPSVKSNILHDDECGALMEWYWQRTTDVLAEKPVSVAFCPPQIPHGLTWDRARAYAVRDQPITAWATARTLRTKRNLNLNVN